MMGRMGGGGGGGGFSMPSNAVTTDDISNMAYQEWKIPGSKELGTSRGEFKNMHGLGEDFLKNYDIFDKDYQAAHYHPQNVMRYMQKQINDMCEKIKEDQKHNEKTKSDVRTLNGQLNSAAEDLTQLRNFNKDRMEEIEILRVRMDNKLKYIDKFEKENKGVMETI